MIQKYLNPIEKFFNFSTLTESVNKLELTGTSFSITPSVTTIQGCGTNNPIPPPETSDLEVNLLLLKDKDSNKILFVSIDALYVGPKLMENIYSGLEGLLRPDQIFCAASHTHNAPMLDDTKPLLGGVNEEHLEYISSKIVENTTELFYNKAVIVTATSFRYLITTSVDRRKKRIISIRKNKLFLNRVLLAPNIKSNIHPTAERIDFKDEKDKLVSTIWIMPCHPTSHPNPSAMSANFIGRIRQKYRDQLDDKNMPFIFLQGASGDLRPPAFAPLKFRVKPFFSRILNGKSFGDFTDSDYTNWVENVWEEFNSGKTLRGFNITQHKDLSINTKISSISLDSFFSYQYHKERRISFQQVAIGNISIFGLSAEATWRLREEMISSDRDSTIVGCISDTFGYITTEKQFQNGGYEATDFWESFSLKPLRESNNLHEARKVFMTFLFSE